MLTFLKTLFRKSPAIPAVIAPRVVQEPAIPIAKVETASLSLAAILNRFPAELKKTVAKMPEGDVMVALPLSTIQKQLPGGSVKMSLASIYRQAPQGTFTAPRVEDKRMVDVPLGEIFKRVKPELLKRRADQRRHELAEEEGFDVFGDPENPYAVAPRVPEPASAPEPKPEPVLRPAPVPFAQPRAVGMPEPMVAAPPIGASPAPTATPVVEPMRTVAPPPSLATAAAPVAAPATKGPLTLSLAEISAGWPEQVQAEIASLKDSTVSVPSAEVTAGLAKGKVAFTWGQIRQFISPPITASTQVPEGIELQLPLRIVAPLFLKASKDGAGRKRHAVDDSIPVLFAGGPAKAAPPAEPIAPPAETPAPATEAPAPVVTAPEIPKVQPESTAPAAAQPSPAPVEAVAPVPAPSHKPASSIGEVFGKPEKKNWTPVEIVHETVKLPHVAGAVVALQEGLVVAHEMPPAFKGDVIAAFLPQIFSRLNQYSNEMQLGDVDDMVMCTHGAYFQIFRLGYVFFAVLGKQGETLPWHELRVIADELKGQTQK